MTPTNEEFQRAGLLAVLAQFATNTKIDVVTRLSIKEATLKVLDEYPINDGLEKQTRILIR